MILYTGDLLINNISEKKITDILSNNDYVAYEKCVINGKTLKNARIISFMDTDIVDIRLLVEMIKEIGGVCEGILNCINTTTGTHYITEVKDNEITNRTVNDAIIYEYVKHLSAEDLAEILNDKLNNDFTIGKMNDALKQYGIKVA